VALGTLQGIIYRLYRVKDFKNIKRVCNTILSLKIFRILAIDSTFNNKGGKTPGLDGKSGMVIKDINKFIKVS
jgi:hypothetical protein